MTPKRQATMMNAAGYRGCIAMPTKPPAAQVTQKAISEAKQATKEVTIPKMTRLGSDRLRSEGAAVRTTALVR